MSTAVVPASSPGPLASQSSPFCGLTRQDDPEHIYVATISPTVEVCEGQTNPSIIGRAFSRDSQLRCSIVFIVDGISFILLTLSLIIIGSVAKTSFRMPYPYVVETMGFVLGHLLIATGALGISAVRTRRTVEARVCAVLSLLSCAMLFICFVIVVTQFQSLTESRHTGVGFHFIIFSISIPAFIIGITVGIILTLVELRILNCFGKKPVDVTSSDIHQTTSPMLFIRDDDNQLAITQGEVGNDSSCHTSMI